MTRCSCTGSCGKGPNVVVGGKGKKEKVVYETNSVGAAVKMLREEFELQVCACVCVGLRVCISAELCLCMCVYRV